MSYDPNSIANINAWYKTDSLGLADGASVASWSDSSSSGFTATQATGTKQPIYHTNQVNGQPALTFTAANLTNMSSGADGSFPSGFTVFAVVSSTTVTTAEAYLGSTGNGIELRLNTTGKNELLKESVSSIAVSNNAVSINTWTILTTDYANAGTTNVHFFKNGTAIGSSSSSTILATGQTIFIGSKAGNAEFWAGQIAEIITYSRVLNVVERAQIHSYLQDKYAITVSDFISKIPFNNYEFVKVGDGMSATERIK